MEAPEGTRVEAAGMVLAPGQGLLQRLQCGGRHIVPQGRHTHKATTAGASQGSLQHPSLAGSPAGALGHAQATHHAGHKVPQVQCPPAQQPQASLA